MQEDPTITILFPRPIGPGRVSGVPGSPTMSGCRRHGHRDRRMLDSGAERGLSLQGCAATSQAAGSIGLLQDLRLYQALCLIV